VTVEPTAAEIAQQSLRDAVIAAVAEMTEMSGDAGAYSVATLLGCLGAQIAAEFAGGEGLNRYLTNAQTCGKSILRAQKAARSSLTSP
jgi:hypothetical protein